MTSPSDPSNIDPEKTVLSQSNFDQPTVPQPDLGYSGFAQQQGQPIQAQPAQTQQPQILPPPNYQQPVAHQQYQQGPGSAFGLPGQPQQFPQPVPTKRSSGRGAGMLVAGIAIGALLGGIAGGGTAALIGANQQQAPIVAGNGTVEITNPDTATAITAVAAAAKPSVVTLEVNSNTASGTGSGVIISSDGYILSNAHVVTVDGGASDPSVRVQLSDGRLLQAKVVGVDPYSDLAVVKVDATDLPAVKWADSSDLNVGDLTVAIGAPLNLADTVTSGVVSALNRGISVGSPLVPQNPGQSPEEAPENPWDFRFDVPNPDAQAPSTGGGQVTLAVIQTDASINPGNSGGALLNGAGELIGINVAIASPAASSSGAAGSAGLGFAIPSNLAKRVSESLIAGDAPSHGLLGTTVTDSENDPLATVAGALLGEVVRGGAADKAGLRSGDVVTSVNGITIDDGTSLSALVRFNAGGSAITLGYVRDGAPGEVEVMLGTL
jgi:putative serine protease PepD